MKNKSPLLEYDPDRNAILNPNDVVKPLDIPQHAVLCFFNNEIHKLNQKGLLRPLKKLRSEMGTHIVYAMKHGQQDVVLLHPGMGASFAAVLFEELIALGCRKFIACGGAGVLDQAISMGHLLVPDTAIRDEGTSFHYLPPAREVHASEEAVNAIEDTLRRQQVPFTRGKTWTTDAIYRETPAKIASRKSEGCLTVEMEAAALFAVAQFRGVKIGQILYAGDDVSGTEWDSRSWVKQSEIRQKLIYLAAEACLQIQ